MSAPAPTRGSSALAHDRLTIGVDVGGTSTRVGAVDSSGSVLVLAASATPHGPEAVTGHVVREVRQVLAKVDGPVTSIGVGIPGRIDPATRELSMAVNLGIVEPTPLGTDLEAALDMAVCLGNDVDLAALGAHQHLGGGRRSVAYVSIGTGFAVGLVLDGHLHRGARGAGEIGHVPVPGGTDTCSCGQIGCVETLASGGSMLRAWGRPDATIASLWTAADDGDPRAASVRTLAIDAIAWAVQCTTMLFDPDVVVIGGGVSRLGHRLVDLLTATIDRRAHGSDLLASYGIADRLVLAPVDAELGVSGAALFARAAAPAGVDREPA